MDNINKAIEEYIKERYKDLVHNNNELKNEIFEEKLAKEQACEAYKELLKYTELSVKNVKESVSHDDFKKIMNNLIPIIAENYVHLPKDGFTDDEIDYLNKKIETYRNKHDLINLKDYFEINK